MHQDLFLSRNDLFGLVICIMFSWWILSYAKKFYSGDLFYKDFRIGFYLRWIGVIASAFFNLYIIKADSTSFFGGAKLVAAAIRGSDLSDSVQLFFTGFDDLPFRMKCFFSNDIIINLIYDNNRTLVHMAGILSFLTFDSYLAISFVMSMWAYWGLWLVYATVIQLYPASRKWLFYLIIAYPPLCFWTTGLMKDPICIGSLGVLFYVCFNQKERKLRPYFFCFLGVLAAFLLIKIKGYLFVGFSIAAILAYFIYRLGKMTAIRRWVSIGVFAMLLLVFFYNFGAQLEDKIFETFSEEVVDRISTVTETQLRHGGSSYDLGEFDLSGWSMVKYSAAAINVALFRPYVWEYLNPLVLSSSLEGMLMFFMLLYLVVKIGPKGIISSMGTSPIMIFALIFTIITAMMAGGIAFNYGTLARYKIPLTPFYFIFMICIGVIHRQNKTSAPSSSPS